MARTLLIAEVSRKQDYIFSSRHLKDNAERSDIIRYVSDSRFFEKAAPGLYREADNLIYSGGGHTVLQFADAQQAAAFAEKVTEAAMREFDGLELFVKQYPYNPGLTPGKNLLELTKALERKKSRRAAAFGYTTLGVEALDGETFQPVHAAAMGAKPEKYGVQPPAGMRYPTQFEELTPALGEKNGRDNFLAVVHIDGNAMGKRVERIYQKEQSDWDACCASLRRFSEGIQADFEAAFSEMTETVIGALALAGDTLPLRPVILAGDDVCFVCAGSIGLECARVFLEKLSQKANAEDGQKYAACAGVALVHQKFPFHQAYDLAEELCSSAKKFGAAMAQQNPQAGGSVSALDWHIEFGQLKDSLSELRRDYETEDGNRLELRPVSVVVPEGLRGEGVRDYRYFRALCETLQNTRGDMARGKIKELRAAMKQGEQESRYFLQDQQITEILYAPFNAQYRTWEEQSKLFRAALAAGETGTAQLKNTEAFVHLPGEEFSRSLFFDAIEMIDHCQFFEEAKQ